MEQNKRNNDYVTHATFNSETDHTPVGDVKYGDYEYLPDSGAAPYVSEGAGGAEGGDMNVDGGDGVGGQDYYNGDVGNGENIGGDGMQDVGGYDSGSFYETKKPPFSLSDRGKPSQSTPQSENESQTHNQQFTLNDGGKSSEANSAGAQFALSNRGRPSESSEQQNNKFSSSSSSDNKGISFSLSDRGRPQQHENQNLSSGQTSNDSKESDFDYLVKYFPGGKHVYNFDENGTITGTSDVSWDNRKDIKRAVCAHWYYFTFGNVSDDDKAKEVADRLFNLKGDLSLTNHIKKKVF